MTITTIPPTFYQVAFNAPPNQAAIPPWWTDISNRVQFAWETERGRQYELDQNETGEWRTSLANPDGALDPSNTASPFAPNIVPYRQTRIKVTPGPNLLTPDQATCGQASGYPTGRVPGQMGVGNDFGYPLTLAASGNAYTGSQVYQVTVPAGQPQFTTILIIPVVSVVPGQTYSASAEVLITSGSSVQCNVGLVFFDHSGNQLSAGPGSPQTVTSGSSSWTTLTVTTQAPSANTPAAYAYLKVFLNAMIANATTFQVGALQLEDSATSTPWQQPNTAPRNLLPQQIATGTAAINPAADSASNWIYADTGTITQANFLTAAPSGQTTAIAWTTPSGTTGNSHLYVGGGSGTITSSGAGPVADCVQVAAAAQYTASVYLSRTASADATVQVTVGWRFFDINGNLLSAPAGTAVTVPTSGWVRGTCTATAPAGAAWGRVRIYITTPSSTTASNTLYTTGWQVEAAAAASTWVDPGPVYQIINGYVERWPQTWSELDGAYGTSDIVGPDQLTALAQYTLADPFTEEVLALGPNFFYQLNDPAGSTSCADAAGKRTAAPVENSPFGPGSLIFGSSVTSTSAAGAFVGTPGPVATFNNNPTQTIQSNETFVSIHKTAVSPGPPPAGNWTRTIAFRSSTAPTGTSQYFQWGAFPPGWTGNLSRFYISLIASGFLTIIVNEPGLHGLSYTGTTNLCDGNWHQVTVVVNVSVPSTTFYVDGAQVSTTVNSVVPTPTGCMSDAVGCAVVFGVNEYNGGAVGDVAHVAEFPAALSAAQIANLYNSFRTASSGESTGARIQRILNWIGWTGPTAVAAGQTLSMGPATDLAGDAGLDAINAVVLTENGNFYASNQGVLTFQARNARYDTNVPTYTFGERAGAGEWPFEILYFDDDPSHIANNVQITQYNAATYTVVDAASTQANFPRVYQRTVNTTSVNECLDAANYLLSQYKGTALRIEQLRLHPSAVPGLFNVCLNIEIGTRIRVNRRPTGAPMITWDGFVEKVSWTWDPDESEVFVDLQCSPANNTDYWVLGALHMTLHAAATSGTNTISINALPDSAVNALRSSLPTSAVLVLDPGTAIQETVTVAPGGIPATNPGYTSAILTLTGNLANNHAVNAVVCEPLPTGVSDPTTYDTQSVLGATSTALNLPATAGANTVTVSALSDATANAAGSDWNTGNLLQIGGGTANFEGYNMLSPNISTAGGGVFPLAAGTTGTALGLTGVAGTPTVTASGSAFQGSQVWQTSVPASQASPSAVLVINKVGATANLPYTASAYVRSATSGANPQVFIYIEFLSATGVNLGSTSSTASTLTGSTSAAWTRIAVTATAPTGTVWAQVGIVMTGTAPSVAWAWQGDGLQLEQAAAARAYQTCPQIQSISTTYPGYSTCVITLASVLANSHVVGEIVCDVLPPGDSSPSQVAATAVAAY